MNKLNCYFEVVSNYKDQNIQIPQRQTKFSAGYDLSSAVDIILKPQEMKLIPTGIKVFLPHDTFLLICVRSSLANKKKIMLANNIGIVDADYYNNSKNEGHIFVNLYNFSNSIQEIKKNERIAQGIFQRYYVIDNEILTGKEKRKGGFGSTGN